MPTSVAEIFADVFATPIAIPDGDLRLSISSIDDSGRAEVRAMRFDAHGVAEIVEQEVMLSVTAAPARLRVFFIGARAAAPDLLARDGQLLPEELFPAGLVDAALASAEDFRDALRNMESLAAALAPQWIRTFEQEHGICSALDAKSAELLWSFSRTDVAAWLDAATELVRQEATAAIPHLICVLEGFRSSLEEHGTFALTEDDRDACSVVAAILESLVSRAETPDWQHRFVRLREASMFTSDGA